MIGGRVRRVAAALGAALVLGSAALPGLAAAAPRQRASFNDVQSSLMCIACHEALPVAQSPEAYSENAYVRQLIRQGKTKQEILHDMVVQYGPAVLAKPPAHGINVLVYIVPGVAVVVGLTVLGITLPRWRRRSRAAAADPLPSVPKLSDEESQRLDADLARNR